MPAIPVKLSQILLISAVAITVFIGGTFLLHIVPLAAKNKIADGLLADFVITFPTLYYFIIVRPLKLSARSLLLVFSAGCLIAFLVLPQQQRDYILQIRKLTAVGELFFIVYAVTRFRAIRKIYRAHKLHFADPIYNLRSAMTEVFSQSLAIKVLAAELAVIRYGLLFWKKEKTPVSTNTSFSTHKEFGYIAIWCILLLAVMVEVTAFHLLLMKWSNTAAIIVTILSLYGAVFLIADLSAIIKRKVIISGEQVILRTGLRWRLITDLSNIKQAGKIGSSYQSTNVYFKGGVIKNSGDMLISFKEPVLVEKLYGPSKQFNEVLMNIDDAESFIKTLNIIK